MNPTAHRLGSVWVNHLGFACRSLKHVIVAGHRPQRFEVQNMALNRPAGMGERENFQAILEGVLTPVSSPLGDYSVGDFSSIEKPGIYRVVLPDTEEHSYHFTITDGAFSWLPRVFLHFIHNWRSGPYENAWRGPTTLDDGRRTDDGKPMDASGGWFDAGDTRKWMVHSNLAALAFMEAHDKLAWQFTDWERVDPGWSPWLLETLWGLEFILKMQDPGDGMFYEDVGGGGNSRKRDDLSWWYENHSGCYADNADNRFTDNTPDSGDERAVRIQYNPIVQFVNTTILAHAGRVYREIDAPLAGRCEQAAIRGWQLGLSPDPKYLKSPDIRYAAWTSVRSWRLQAALILFQAGHLPWLEVQESVHFLLENFDPSLGFWRNETGGKEPYRGILHSAQPIIALCKTLELPESAPLRDSILTVLKTCFDQYILPLSELTPFRIIPFGVYARPASEGDLYRPWRDGLFYRFFMPEFHVQRINHGLSAHYTSWAHGLALLAKALNEPRCVNLAWAQLHWLIGQNPYNSTSISGVGYNNPMPHSRLLGTFPGGFCTGFCGTPEDMPHQDTEADAQWNSTEYWQPGIASTLLALGNLPPTCNNAQQKLGLR